MDVGQRPQDRSAWGGAKLPAMENTQATDLWPEFATCVGVSLGADDSLHIVAPHGLEDLFALRVRHNPVRASAATYRQRVEQKRYAQRWPRVEVIPAEESRQMFPSVGNQYVL